MNGGDGNAERFTDLGHRKAAKETQLNDLALTRIEPLQFAERLIHAGQIDLARFVEFRGELQPIFAAAHRVSAGSDLRLRTETPTSTTRFAEALNSQ